MNVEEKQLAGAPVGKDPHPRPIAEPSELVRPALTVIALLATVVLLLLLICYTAGVFLLFFAAVLLAVLLRGLGDRLSAISGIPPRYALWLTVLGLGAATALTGWMLATHVSSQIDELGQQLSRGAQQAKLYLQHHAWGRHLPNYGDDFGWALSSGRLLSTLPGFVSSSLGVVVDLLVILFMGLYLAIDPGQYVEGLVHLVPFGKRDRTRELLASLWKTLEWWLVGRFLSMVEVGLLTSCVLWLLGVPLPFTLGLLTGLMNFVPNVGPALATFLTVLVGLSVSPIVAVYALIAQVLIGSIDGFVVTPLIQQRTVSLPAGLILGSQVLTGVLMGGLGVALATPLAAAVFVLVKKLYVNDVLDDQTV